MNYKLTQLLRVHHSKLLYWLALFFSLVFLLMLFPIKVHAQSDIKLVSSSITSEFPTGIHFQVEATSSQPVTEITVKFTEGNNPVISYDYLQFTKGTDVKGDLLYRTDTAARYTPPGTPINYHFEIQDAAGNTLVTDTQTFVYGDPRFQWYQESEGLITIYYHDVSKSLADEFMSVIDQTNAHMGPILGAKLTTPVNVLMYNNIPEMLKALPPSSTSISTELVTAGMAFPQMGVILVLDSSTLANGTVSHEFTHILVGVAAYNPVNPVPSWLNEGLAEYGNIDPGTDYDQALAAAIASNSLIPIIYLDNPPGTPQQIILFYGEGRSIVRYLVNTYGPAKMAQLMAAIKAGKQIDDALTQVYGVDRQGLDAEWRKAIGAPPYIPPNQSAPLPTPPPLPSLAPYSLTPQPGSTATSLPSAQPTTTPVSNTPTPAKVTGGSCSGPIPGYKPGIDVSLIMLTMGLVAMGAVRRKKR